LRTSLIRLMGPSTMLLMGGTTLSPVLGERGRSNADD
jgi:hypothetical protein